MEYIIRWRSFIQHQKKRFRDASTNHKLAKVIVLDDNGTISKKINISLIAHFFLGQYSFSFAIFDTASELTPISYLSISFFLWFPSNSDHNPLNCTIWGVLATKTNATSHPTIDSLKNAMEAEWNKISEEFIFKACKSFRRPVELNN